MYDTKQKTRTGLSVTILGGLISLLSVRANAQDTSESPGQTGASTGAGDASSQVEASGEWGASPEASSSARVESTAQASSSEKQPAVKTAEESDEETSRVPSFFKPFVGNLYFLGGVGFHDTGPINSRLDAAGFSEVGDPALSLGFGGDVSIGRLILGTEWHWLQNVGTESSRDAFRADMKTNLWLARIGVDLAKWRGLRVYPLFGIGVGSTTIRISQEQGASFDDVLATPNREVRMTQTGLLLDASLGIDYRFTVRDTEEKTRFFTLGVRGGYLFAPYSRGWETAAAEISGGPDLMTSGPTVQLMIGFSGRHKKPYYKRHRHHHR